ncbi:MAG: glycerophosphodiester phosphodiesterase [Planctomycetaceae bacterium]|nr:glycerophosphodiester phosphodiesterase [Planctomycetaceae bacterium]
MSHVEIIAHRGASSDAPENTLAAIQLAWQQGADAAEIDVQLTADGQLVAIHDETMLRTAGVDWAVKDRTLAELKTLDVGSWKSPLFAGERIPTLAEVLDLVPIGKRLFIEVKCGVDAIPELVCVLSAAKTTREQTVLIGLDFDTIVAVKRALPDRVACWVTEQSWCRRSACNDAGEPPALWPTTAELIEQALAAKLDSLDINNLPERPTGDIGQITRAGLQAYAWTVNSAERAAWHQAEGIHGITTDVPGRMIAKLK